MMRGNDAAADITTPDPRSGSLDHEVRRPGRMPSRARAWSTRSSRPTPARQLRSGVAVPDTLPTARSARHGPARRPRVRRAARRRRRRAAINSTVNLARRRVRHVHRSATIDPSAQGSFSEHCDGRDGDRRNRHRHEQQQRDRHRSAPRRRNAHPDEDAHDDPGRRWGGDPVRARRRQRGTVDRSRRESPRPAATGPARRHVDVYRAGRFRVRSRDRNGRRRCRRRPATWCERDDHRRRNPRPGRGRDAQQRRNARRPE